MDTVKILSLSIVAASLVLVTGCTTVPTATNTNEVSNTNTNIVNTNVVVKTNENTNTIAANENTNTEQGSEVDTSDWLTYTNDEYGFSFRYPSDAKLAEDENNLPYPGITFLSDVSVDNTKQNDLQGVTVVFAVTELDLTTLTDKIEQSDTSQDITLAKVGPIQEGQLNQVTVYQGSHATAIGIPTDFYYVPLKNNFALFIFYKSDKNSVNSNIINTLSVEN